MKTNVFFALLAAVFASAAAPAFASGYGPAPVYEPSVGAPAAQSAPSLRTIGAERADTGREQAYGGAASGLSQAGSRATLVPRQSLFAHH
ncbi:hypothetical protein CI15_15180 [Paraburkholderia monticola]|uniref:Alpha/beta hydrolase n=1 Tax=Paraburkholderia monticola TaxID=1399968 RepID=A0A149PR39_9BURK|nr:hypothetical protein [Paraburkholderia monticola]KXU87488.1 hypothetical protein CI15_15180 [Paraburkholderia monticola]